MYYKSKEKPDASPCHFYDLHQCALPPQHTDDLLADRTAEIVVDQTEAIAVIWSAQIVPDSEWNRVVIEKLNHISEPIFTPDSRAGTYRAEFAARQYRVGMRVDEFLRGRELIADEFSAYLFVVSVCVLSAV